MNPYPPATANLADTINTLAFLRQAVEHYPRLAAFSFTLALPYCDNMAEYRSLILCFHTEVWQRTGEYSWRRQQERKNSPPTLLRWIWEAASALECKMVLLMNPDTPGAVSNEQRIDNAQQAISGIIREAWQTVTDADRSSVTNLTSVIINRSGRGTLTMPLEQLKAQVQAMVLPVATARTCATGSGAG